MKNFFVLLSVVGISVSVGFILDRKLMNASIKKAEEIKIAGTVYLCRPDAKLKQIPKVTLIQGEKP